MAFWDFLRPLTQMAWDLNIFAEGLAMVLSIAILVISLLAYNKTKSKRLLLVSAAFFFFTLKWVLKVVDQFVSPYFFVSRAAEAVLDLVILALLFYAIFKK